MKLHPRSLTLLAIVLFVGSTMQYGDYTVARYFIPSVSFGVCAVGLLFTRIRLHYFDRSVLALHVAFFGAMMLVSYLNASPDDELLFDFVKIFVATGMSLAAYLLVSRLPIEHLLFVLKLTFVSCFVFLALELYLRVTPYYAGFGSLVSNFYKIKDNSPFMSDSNPVAIYIILYVIVLFTLWKYGCIRSKLFLGILCLFLFFLLMTLSRAGIAAVLVLCGLHLMTSARGYTRYVLFIGTSLVVALAIPYLLSTVTSDASGLTKLKIVWMLPSIFNDVDWREGLLGFGIKGGARVYSYAAGKYSHLTWTLLLGQFGVIGLLLYALFFLLHSYLSKFGSVLFLVVLFILSLSYLPPFFETIFLVHGAVIGLYRKVHLSSCTDYHYGVVY